MSFKLFKNKYTILPLLLIIIVASYAVFNISNKTDDEIGKSENGYRVDKEPIINRFPNLNNFDKCYWKANTIGSTDFGPTSYWMKGFVFLNSKELDTIKTKYKWSDVESSWKPSLDTSILKAQSLKWRYSEEFNNYVKSADYVGKFYLELENGVIYFDIQK